MISTVRISGMLYCGVDRRIRDEERQFYTEQPDEVYCRRMDNCRQDVFKGVLLRRFGFFFVRLVAVVY